MTTKQKPTNSESEATASIKSVAKDFKGVGTLRRRLLVSILPAVLLPLVIASAIGYTITERRVKKQVVEKLETDTLLVSTKVTTFLQNSFEINNLIAANPDVIQLMKSASKKAQEQELVQQPIADLEKKFAASKLLITDDKLNNYLQQIIKSDQIAEIFLTERNGFNVAYSNLTSDFIQRDEGWWKNTQKNGQWFDEPEFDESANAKVIAFSKAVKDHQTGEFLGVIKAGMTMKALEAELVADLQAENEESAQFQIVDPDDSFVITNIHYQDIGIGADERTENIPVVGGDPIVRAVKTLVNVEGNSLRFEEEDDDEEEEEIIESDLSLEEAQQLIDQQKGFSEVSLHQKEIYSKIFTVGSFRYQDKVYSLATVPGTDMVSIGVVDYEIVASTGRSLLIAFELTAVFLGIFSVGLIILLAQQLSRPLTNLSEKTQQVAAGNLDIKADLEGTLETRTLADNFNNLVKQVKESLQKEQASANEQRQEKEKLEAAIYTLIDEVSDATDGDLTVRANLDSMELSTVADLFNAIIDNLQDIAVEAKHSTSQVGSSLKQNEEAIRTLAEEAIAEAQETRDTLIFVEQMSQSIQAIATNANQAEKIADDTYNTVLNSTDNMNLTVDSILDLRNTVGETAKKMKRLGESSQKISQVVSFIEEIALRTNILAINATVEAGRAGEYGQGFTIVAEQVAGLSEQCGAATKEIASIVAAIQAETQEVSQAMESGTIQVVESTRLVENTKQSLSLVLEKSREINQLMGSISQTTVSQANTSQNVTSLMQKIANLSENTSRSSTEVAKSIVETAQVAEKLESTVAQFKVAQSV